MTVGRGTISRLSPAARSVQASLFWKSGVKRLQSFAEFPVRQKPASFNLDEVMQKLSAPKN